GPPYAPKTQSSGGSPDMIPDIPITAVFLALYVAFAVIHFSILKANQKRDHKFIFSGAIFGFCKIRIITMSLRIAWACHKTNVSLAIAAQIFVYVGTVILYIVNWFFTQRIVRAQHPRWGWSLPYRVAHRACIVFLICCLLMLVVAGIQQFFTLNTYIHMIDRNLQVTGQTYFAFICFLPIVVVLISLALPRKGTEKFGAGRLRINIAILLTGAIVLSIGQIFRCVTTWLPPVALRSDQGQLLPLPWYFSKACFYGFNFLTEILVVIFYAVVRVDLRFHVPNKSNGLGAYSEGKFRSPYHSGEVRNGKHASKDANMLGTVDSKDTLHEYEASIFDDTRTLADSLRYPSSVLEVDSKTGNWKIKRASLIHTRYSQASEHSLWSSDRDTMMDAPPIPPIPTGEDWPLRASQISTRGSPTLEHRNRHSKSPDASSARTTDPSTNTQDVADAIAQAIAKLEANSDIHARPYLKQNYDDADAITKAPPPAYDSMTPRSRPKMSKSTSISTPSTISSACIPCPSPPSPSPSPSSSTSMRIPPRGSGSGSGSPARGWISLSQRCSRGYQTRS
ncbi:hypothetical protein P154DRAFT_421040, partial [Amniculicola lignicola CBS 123094]